MTSRGFPNQFFTGFTQVGISANIAANYELQGEHIAYIIAEALAARCDRPSSRRQEAQDDWCATVRETRDRQLGIRRRVHAGLLQQRGWWRRARASAVHLGEPYAPGFYAFGDLLAQWRDQGLTWNGLRRCGEERSVDRRRELRFDDRVAVVTGAGRGLGRAYALLLASRGAKVVVNDSGGSLTGDGVDAGPAADVVARDQRRGGEAVACTDRWPPPAGGQAIVEAALDHFGRIDILIHNAGNVRRARAEGHDATRTSTRCSTSTCAAPSTWCGRHSR